METNKNHERREENRINCHWPIWFANGLNKKIIQGELIDISSKAASFTCYSHENHFLPGQTILTNFSVPIYGLNDSFALRQFTRSGSVFSVDVINKKFCRIVTQFTEKLSFKPGEQENFVTESVH